MEEKKQPWDKLKGETDKAYDTFLLFAALPLHRRSVRELHRDIKGLPKATDSDQKRTTPPSSWYRWFREHDWINRARARDSRRIKEERERFLEEQKEDLLGRKKSLDSLIDACESALSPDRLDVMVSKFPSSVVGYHKTLVSVRKDTERDLLDLFAVKVQESPREPTEKEEQEIASLVAMLRVQAKDGNATATRLLLALNGVNL